MWCRCDKCHRKALKDADKQLAIAVAVARNRQSSMRATMLVGREPRSLDDTYS
jgi:hypothetical protein